MHHITMSSKKSVCAKFKLDSLQGNSFKIDSKVLTIATNTIGELQLQRIKLYKTVSRLIQHKLDTSEGS